MVKPGAVVIDVGMNRIADATQEERHATGRRRRVRRGARGRVADHAGARRRGQDDDRDADGEHRSRRGAAVAVTRARAAARAAAQRGARICSRRRRARDPTPRVAEDAAARSRTPVADDAYPGETARLGGRRVDAHADRARRRRRRVHPALGARRDHRLQVASQRPLVFLSARLAPRRSAASCGIAISARIPARARRRHAGRRVRTAHRVSGARRDAVHDRRASKRRATGCGARRSRSRARDSRPTDCSRRSASARCRVSARHRGVTSPDGAALHDIIAVHSAARGAMCGSSSCRRRCRATQRPKELCRALDQVESLGRGGPRDHRPRRRRARGSLGVQRRARRARASPRAACRRSPRSATRSTSRSATSSPTIARRRRRPPPKPRRRRATELEAELARTLDRASRAVARVRARHVATACVIVGRDVVAASAERIGHASRASLESVAGRLHALSPVATLARGYAVARGRGRHDARRRRRPFSRSMPFELVAARRRGARAGRARERRRERSMTLRAATGAARGDRRGARGARASSSRVRWRCSRKASSTFAPRPTSWRDAEATVQRLVERADGTFDVVDTTSSSVASVDWAADRAAIDRALVDALRSTSRRIGSPRRATRFATACSAAESGCAGCSSSRRTARPAATATRRALAAAIEVVHAYSLVHDDLPCMDDDDMRRGRPTVHRVFGVRVATAAGVAMVPLAARAALRRGALAGLGLPRTCAARSSRADARVRRGRHDRRTAARSRGRGTARSTLDELERIHRAKTGALIAASVALGGIARRARTPRGSTRSATFGDAIGLAFQIADDVLDVTATTDRLGKTAGRDLDLRKSTYPALLGVDGRDASAPSAG